MSLNIGERVKRDRCGFENCPSKWYTLDPDGYLYCQNSHRREAPLATGEDEDAFGTEGRTARKQKEEREKVHQQFQGHRGFELYLQCYQLLLWKQSYWLIHSKGFPKEVEVIIRDLWTFRLQKFAHKVKDDFDSETQSQMFSSQEDTATDTDHDGLKKTRRGKSLASAPRLIDTLSLCYLGLLLLRLPVSVGDIHRWVNSEDLIYYGAIREISASMRERLPSEYHEALEPHLLLRPDALHTSVMKLAIAYEHDFDMHFPPLNVPSLLLKYLKELALPLEVYPVVARLAHLVSYKFVFPRPNTTKRLRIINYPEAQLVALVVVAVKILWPFDGKIRYPATTTEPAVAAVDWAAWTRASAEYHKLFETPGRLDTKGAQDTLEDDVFSLSDQQLDDYLDWYKKNWVEKGANEKKGEFSKTLLEMFPTSKRNNDRSPVRRLDQTAVDAAKISQVKAVQQALLTRQPFTDKEMSESDTEISRPGSHNKLYRNAEELSGDAKVFFEATADLVGLSVQSLVKAVFLTETKLERWKETKKREDAEKRALCPEG